jgi:hypothetical protein
MQLLDGRISYRKDPERGASFRVTLPRAAPAAAASAAPAAPAASPPGQEP